MISRGTRQRSSWINVNDDVTTAARLNSARFQATIYSASCVSYSPPTCSSTASRRYLLRVLFGDFSFPFFPSFLPSFSFPFPSPPLPPSLSLLHFIIKSARITIGSNSTCRMEIHWEIGILIWSRTIVESKAFVRRMVFPLVRIDGISLVDDRCHDRPYFRIYHYLFFPLPPRIVIFRPHFVLQPKFFTIFLID